MAIRTWTEADTQRALEIWREYQLHHDVAALHGKAVGIDTAARLFHIATGASK